MYQFVSEVNGVDKRKFQKAFYKLGDETYIQKFNELIEEEVSICNQLFGNKEEVTRTLVKS